MSRKWRSSGWCSSASRNRDWRGSAGRRNDIPARRASEGQRVSDERYLALQVVMMPRDANPHATIVPGTGQTLYMTIFGGILLSYIDQAGAIGAAREVVRAGGEKPILVTVALNRVEFLKPVHVGDVVRFSTRLVKMGRTSITMQVAVESERGTEVIPVTEAEVVYVGIDLAGAERHPKPLLPSR